MTKEEIKKAIEDKAVTAPFHEGESDTMYWQLSVDEWEEIWS